MSDVRAKAGVPVTAQFAGYRTPTDCAPLVVDSTTGFIYSWKAGDVIFLAGPGSYTLPTATSSVLGGVKPDGTTITNTSGAISVTYGTASSTAAQGNDSRITGAVQSGGALGSPSSAGTMPAFTLGGTVSGGGQQVNNVIIGTSTPLAGSFTTLTETTGVAWTTYTPTLSADTGSFGTMTITAARYRLLGKTLFLYFNCNATVASGSPTNFILTFPTGTAKVDFYSASFMISNGANNIGVGVAGAGGNQIGFARIDGSAFTTSVFVRQGFVIELA